MKEEKNKFNGQYGERTLNELTNVIGNEDIAKKVIDKLVELTLTSLPANQAEVKTSEYKIKVAGLENDYVTLTETLPTEKPIEIKQGKIKLDAERLKKVLTQVEKLKSKPVIKNTDENMITKEMLAAASPINAVNKNAYEIRLEVLKEAIQWLQLETNIKKTDTFENGDDVLALAAKFYAFVENKKIMS